ncbi:MAG: PP2C family protein-serine/threonine phosphatase [Planctomycetota bacterium]|jgi:sigma-B regulation protein RsbU (phosphoserine phosphatase)
MLPPDVDPGDTLYIVDKDLRLVYSNDAWTRFASANKGQKVLEASWNRSVLANMSGREKQRWGHIYRLLLEGRVPYHEESFICSSPVERRVYQLRITPKRDAGGAVAWLVHHTIRIDQRQDVVARVGEQLRELEDPDRLTQEYRSRVLARQIRIPGFNTAQHLEPLDEIGGDVLWHREHLEGTTDLVHADAVGHGTASGRLATRIVVLLDEIAVHGQGPGETTSALNRAMLEIVEGDRILFATGLVFQFDASGPQLRISNFGHHSPIFSRSGQVDVESGPPVGMIEELGPWPETNIDLAEHGTRFLVFSDGITEQFDINGEMFGSDRLSQAFRKHLERPLDDMLAGIVNDLSDFRGSALVKDDQTLLAVDFVGHEA